jgi:Uma2 family endonuclease
MTTRPAAYPSHITHQIRFKCKDPACAGLPWRPVGGPIAGSAKRITATRVSSSGERDDSARTVREARPDTEYPQPPHLFLNRGNAGFHDVAAELGGGFANPKVGRGAAFRDFDRDGDLDVLMTTNQGPAYLYRNHQSSGHHAIRLRLIGTKSNRDAMGANSARNRRRRDRFAHGEERLQLSVAIAPYSSGPAGARRNTKTCAPAGCTSAPKARASGIPADFDALPLYAGSMPSQTLVSEEEYLNTSYEPDCEYLDGELVEKNVGTKGHSKVSLLLAAYFLRRQKLWNIKVYTDVRTRIRRGKYLLPDVIVYSGEEPNEEVFTTPPLIWIEVLSPDDRPIRVSRKVRELLAFGVPYVWIIDPQTLESEVYTPQGSTILADGICRIPGTPIEVPLQQLEED